jgi:hypothetical protein
MASRAMTQQEPEQGGGDGIDLAARGQCMIQSHLDCPVEPQGELKRQQHEPKMLGFARAPGQWGADEFGADQDGQQQQDDTVGAPQDLGDRARKRVAWRVGALPQPRPRDPQGGAQREEQRGARRQRQCPQHQRMVRKAPDLRQPVCEHAVSWRKAATQQLPCRPRGHVVC